MSTLLIPVLLALLCAAFIMWLSAVSKRRRRANTAAVVLQARERSLQRHTERQRLATQFSELDL